MLEALFLIKIGVTIIFVLMLSLLAEFLSPKISGIFSGIPTGTAIILFFYALELGPDFAAESSVFNLAGMISLHVFILIYYLVSRSLNGKSIILSSIAAMLGYFFAIALIKQFSFNIFSAALFSIASLILFSYLFRKIPDAKILARKKLSFSVLLSRALIASSIILLITFIAKIIGSKWAGLFSAFPTTVFPLMLIVHLAYDKTCVHTIIKNVPKGQWSTLIYVVTVFLAYPSIGVYLGTLMAYFIVAIFLAVLFYSDNFRNKLKTPKLNKS